MAVQPNPETLKWAIERSGNTVESLEKTWPKLSRWLDGTVEPTLRQMEAFAKKTKINLNLLFAEATPELGLQIADFRTVGTARKTPSPELYDTVNQMLFRQDWMRSYFSEQGYEPVELVGMLADRRKTFEDVGAIAVTLRECLGLRGDWAFEFSDSSSAFKALRDRVEGKHISVVVNGIVGDNTRRALEVEEFRGFVLSDEYAPVVFVNGRDAKPAQIFTLAHELAQLAFAATGVVSPDSETEPGTDQERLCDAIAAELLVPEGVFAELWDRGGNSYKKANDLAKKFKVSFAVCARKARELGFVSADELFALLRMHQSEVEGFAKRSSGGNYYLNKAYRLGSVFGDAVFVAVQSRKLTYREAYRLTGLSHKTFNEYYKEYAL